MARRKFKGGEMVTIKLKQWDLLHGLPRVIDGGTGTIEMFDSGHYKVNLDAEMQRRSGRAFYWLQASQLTLVDNLFG